MGLKQYLGEPMGAKIARSLSGQILSNLIKYFICFKFSYVTMIEEKSLKEGKIYSAEVDRVSGGGNLIVQINYRKHVNLGSLSEDLVGETVTFRYEGNSSGDYLAKGVRKDADEVSKIWLERNMEKPSEPTGNPMRKHAGEKNNLLNKDN